MRFTSRNAPMADLTGIMSSIQYIHPSGRLYVSPAAAKSSPGHLDDISSKLSVPSSAMLTFAPAETPEIPTAVDIGPQAPEKTESNVEKKMEDSSQKTSWHVYNEKAAQEDEEFVLSINTSMDVLLIFAGLFSATATAFLQFTRPLLQEDEVGRSNDLLLALFYKMENSSYPLPEHKPFVAPPAAWAINCLMYASIAGSLLAAFFAILIKQWAASIISGLKSIPTPQLRARTRHFRAEGVRRFYFAHIASFVPVVVHISLVLFGVGIVEFLIFTDEHALAIVVIVSLLLGAGVYFLLSLLPLFYLDAPFQSPMTTFFRFFSSNARKLRSMVSRRGPETVPKPKKVLNELIGRQDHISKHIHLSWELDIDVLVSLMAMADKHTERWILEQTLNDMQELAKIQKSAPRLFCHPAILRTYSYLVSTAVYETSDGVSLARGREPRARALCRFLIWLGSVGAESNSMHDLGQALKDQSLLTEQSALPVALRTHGLKHNLTEDIILGEMAVRELEHISQTNARICTACVDFIVDSDEGKKNSSRPNQTFDYLNSLDPESWANDPKRGRAEREHMIRYIAAQTRCLVNFSPLEPPSNLAYRRLEVLIAKFELADPALAKLWNETMPSSEIKFSNPHMTTWLSEIQMQRNIQD